jgi:serine/threonine-protein kinase
VGTSSENRLAATEGTPPVLSGLRSANAPGTPEDTTTLVQVRPPSLPPAASTTLTPEAALAHDEVERTRLFLKLCAVLAGAGGLAVPFVSGGVVSHVFAALGCAGAVAIVLVFRRTLTAQLLASPRRWTLVCAGLVACSAVAVWFFGVFSPAPMVGTFGIYFLCLGRSMRVALWAYLGGAIAHLVPAALFALHALPDPGLLKPDATTGDMLVAAAMVQVVFASTFALARGSQRTTRDAVQKLHAALVQVQKREALLAEANLELDQALQAGQRGPFTDRFVGEWVVGNVVGRGAMGDVYEARTAARDGEEERARAAIKILHRSLAMDPTHVKRFLREAQIVERMRSPHVVRLLGCGNFEVATDRDDAPPYIVMELLEGHDLAWHLRHEARMAADRALEMVDQVSDALAEAAAADVVHRDLKPQNVFLALRPGEGPVWKVLDFGVSKLASDPGTLTHGAPIGTPAYMAPEQARGERVGPSADVFSLACIAYRALTGRPAFSGSELPQILYDVCFAQPVRPASLAPLPADVERVLALGLAKRAAERMDSARGFAVALRSAFSGSLSPALRARADALVAAAPWGSRPR